MERSTSQSALGKLKNLNHVIEERISQGQSVDLLRQQFPHVRITMLNESQDSLVSMVVSETNYSWNEAFQTNVHRVTVDSYPFIDCKHYAIQSEINLTIIDEEFLVGLLMVVAWIFVFIIISVLFLGELISRNLYSPFYNLLQQMSNFDVRKKRPITTTITSIKELKRLNVIMHHLTRQTIRHYDVLQEFTENLAHEIRTPLANIKGKIELLMDRDLTETDLQSLSSMYDSVLRVSSINKSLVLLMRLEQHPPAGESVDVMQDIRTTISEYEELMEMKNISIDVKTEGECHLFISRLLSPMVWSNLLSNAIRYNYVGGQIQITIYPDQVYIRNTGLSKGLDSSIIFNRFQSSLNNPDAIGIGLALVRKILNTYGYEISYEYKNSMHCFLVNS
ncbi:HAMP domain-containing histidine kinase [Sphingobacterium sp. lm-10]|uniref:sensor histidine kinase n=1 Tax=Sphingobacterium sp. lm-10 TaxID=2944904 RepID=UPI002021F19D|nr:HAMP domain-containing histidine kinase [Sphingobacterium sp. lm-10]